MIVPIVQAMNRHFLNLENDERGLAAVEVAHTRLAVEERECVTITVTTEDDDLEVRVIVRSS